MATRSFFQRLAFTASCLAALSWLNGCASRLVVKSDPSEAEVFAQKSETGERISLGATPLEITRSDFEKRTGFSMPTGDFVDLIVEKRGYRTEHYLLPTGRFGTLTNGLNVKLQEGAKEDLLAGEILQILFTTQKFAVQGEYERAQIELDKAFKLSPRFARALSMRASVYYLQKKYEESLKFFEEAIKVDPQMDDAIKMISKLRKMLNKPVASNGGGQP
jgi:tetratricopeptide (TPR) repeat protein